MLGCCRYCCACHWLVSPTPPLPSLFSHCKRPTCPRPSADRAGATIQRLSSFSGRWEKPPGSYISAPSSQDLLAPHKGQGARERKSLQIKGSQAVRASVETSKPGRGPELGPYKALLRTAGSQRVTVCWLCIGRVVMGPVLPPGFSAENGGKGRESIPGSLQWWPRPGQGGTVKKDAEDARDIVGLELTGLAARRVAWKEVMTRTLGSHVDNGALSCQAPCEKQEWGWQVSLGSRARREMRCCGQSL